jgi:hypothetical protein
MLTEDHKRQRVEAAHEFLQAYETDGEEFLDSIVTGDETWVHYTTPEMKQQSRSLETSRVAEAAEVQTDTVFRQSDGKRLLGQEGVIVVRIHACRYNNQCEPLL